MNARLQVAALLEEADREYLSGSAIAEKLGITRAAVWKCIRQMEEEGYRIEVTRKGYRLSDESDAISKNAVLRYLGDAAPLFDVEVLSQVDSTNTYLKRMAPELKAAGGREAAPWQTVIAGSQSAGDRRRDGPVFCRTGKGRHGCDGGGTGGEQSRGPSEEQRGRGAYPLLPGRRNGPVPV